MKPNFSDAKQHTVTIILIGLIILHINNHYSDLNGPSESQSSPSEVRSVLLNVSAHETTGIYNFLCDFSRVIDINLVGYFLLGLLLYRRIRLHKSINFQLINLDLPSKNDALLTEQLRESSDLLRHSNEMNNIPARSKRRIYCIDKAKDHDAENEPMPTSLSLGTDRKDSEYMSGVLNLDALTSKIKQGLGHELSDMEILKLISNGQLKTRELESVVRNPSRAVELRRLDLSTFLNNSHIIERIPYKDYDYRWYMVNAAKRLSVIYLYLTNRGCRAIFLAGGVKSVVYRDQMTRAPVVWFPSILESVKCIAWIDSEEGFQILKSAFDKTSAHVNLLSVFASPAGRYVHIRFAARTGDAMGMNMVSKATDSALHCLQKHFSNMQIISLSGNMCTDKKPATINTILGRGKSVIAETRLPATILAQVLHTSAYRLSRLAHAKNWIGSAMAGCPGMMGSNAHAANIIAGMFAATGQDLAQVVDSSSCLTQLEIDSSDESLIASVTMPCLEVGTVGGGTRLPGQRACLDLLDLSVDRPTEHLSRLIAGTVLAAELSLMAALDTDDLVKAHMHFNRAKPTPTNASTNPVSLEVHISYISQSQICSVLSMQPGQLRREPPIQPSSIQKMLDENVRLIHSLMAHQRVGAVKEAAELERVLHRNLIYLATIADRTAAQPSAVPVGGPHATPAGLTPSNQVQGTAPNYPIPVVNAPPDVSQPSVGQSIQITVASSTQHPAPISVGSTTISTVGSPIMYQQYLVSSSHIPNGPQITSQAHMPLGSGQFQQHERMIRPPEQPMASVEPNNSST
ncbi:unnamed protein product [Heterobilharzia americana]|nr:unnamed protein product [Heterobilharzia americana]